MNTNNTKYRVITALLLVLASKLLLYAGLLKGYSAYVVQPFLWFLAFFILFDIVDRKSATLYISLLLASINIGALMVIGIVSGWGLNSYDTSIYGIVLNILRITPYVLGLEFLRATVFQRLRSYKSLDRSIVLVAALFTVIMVSLSKFVLSFSDETIMLKLIISSLLPMFSLNLFLSYLLLGGGVWNTVSFSLTTYVFTFIAPVLPNIPWYIEGIAYTAIYLILIMFTILILGEVGIPRIELKKNTLTKRIIGIVSYLSILVVLLLIFAGGFKPFVIASGSMEPNINIGDIVLVQPTDINEIKVGNIIAYHVSNRIVVHRVVEVLNNNGKIYLKTKGDANLDADPGLVTERAVLGKIAFTIPRVGFIALGFQYMMVNYPFLLPALIVGSLLLYAILALVGKDIRKYMTWRWGI